MTVNSRHPRAPASPSLTRTGCFGTRGFASALSRSTVTVLPPSLSATRSASVFQTPRSASRWPSSLLARYRLITSSVRPRAGHRAVASPGSQRRLEAAYFVGSAPLGEGL
jgi:hypothetical protein